MGMTGSVSAKLSGPADAEPLDRVLLNTVESSAGLVGRLERIADALSGAMPRPEGTKDVPTYLLAGAMHTRNALMRAHELCSEIEQALGVPGAPARVG